MKKNIVFIFLLSGLISCTETAVIKTSTIYNLDDKIVSVKIVNRPIMVGDSISKILCNCSVIVKLTHDQFSVDFVTMKDAVNYANRFKITNPCVVEKIEPTTSQLTVDKLGNIEMSEKDLDYIFGEIFIK